MKNRVRQLREEQGLTQKQLGEKVNVSRQAINAVETGKFDPSLWLSATSVCSSTATLTTIRHFQNIRGLSSRMTAIPGQIFIVLSSRQ